MKQQHLPTTGFSVTAVGELAKWLIDLRSVGQAFAHSVNRNGSRTFPVADLGVGKDDRSRVGVRVLGSGRGWREEASNGEGEHSDKRRNVGED